MAQKVSGQPEPPPGPLVKRLRSYSMMKLVAGPWGDLSEDFHILLGTFAKTELRLRIEAKAGEEVQVQEIWENAWDRSEELCQFKW